MPVVLWHMARCTCAADFLEQLKTLSEELRTLEEVEQTEEFAVRALKIMVLRALLRSLAVRALKKKHLAYAQVSLPWISSALQRPQQ